jgi:hypothetical protein
VTELREKQKERSGILLYWVSYLPLRIGKVHQKEQIGTQDEAALHATGQG